MTAQHLLSKTKTAAEQVIDRLDRLEKRLQRHYSDQRTCSRQQFRRKVTVFIPPTLYDVVDIEQARRLDVWTRDVSQGGISFIATEAISAQQIVVRLRFADESFSYFRATIVRRKQVDEAFWEHGACFCERIEREAKSHPTRSDATDARKARECAPAV